MSSKAKFLNRPNRFLVRCQLGNRRVSAFLPNPGDSKNFCSRGARVFLVQERTDGEQKTIYTVVAVERENQPIMLHTHRSNDVARYLLERGKIPGLERARIVKAEVPVGRSRFDFLFFFSKRADRESSWKLNRAPWWANKVAMFPDAVTERGARHLRGTGRSLKKWHEDSRPVHCPLALRPVEVFMPDYHTDLNFARTLQDVRHEVAVIPLAVRLESRSFVGA